MTEQQTSLTVEIQLLTCSGKQYKFDWIETSTASHPTYPYSKLKIARKQSHATYICKIVPKTR